ncbi:invasin domain 3-containing protein [Lysinibacter cavernae]|uniref:Adhesin/invasin n=1 Tax=Lysinibacter cavernae TaxID=1640652 RepID=A0A7X5R2N9_9MICO|nr:invasin domain 3-containing protein [Lysinibacter cavernae]NIH54402.1 adhesin/invasin [Lysinibacter cavernae]
MMTALSAADLGTRDTRGIVARVLAALVTLSLLVAGLVVTDTTSASANVVLDNGYDKTFYITDTRIIPDANPGDGICATASTYGSTCTMLAAAQETNALFDADNSKRYLIAPTPVATAAQLAAGTGGIRQANGTYANDGSICMYNQPYCPNNTPAGNFTGMINGGTEMQNIMGGYTDGDTGVNFWFKGNVVIDLQKRIGSTPYGDSMYNGSVFGFSGSNQVLRNFANVYGSESAIYVGKTAKNFLLENGSIANSPLAGGLSIATERPIVVIGGAENVTINNVEVNSQWRGAAVSVLPQNAAPTTQINGLNITNSKFSQSNAYSSGADDTGGAFGTWYVNSANASARVKNLVMTGNTMVESRGHLENYSDAGTWISTGNRAYNTPASRIILDGALIQDNTFVQNVTPTYNPGYLRAVAIYANTTTSAGVVIANNRVVNNQAAWSPGSAAFYVQGPTGTAVNNTYVTIRDNNIAGWNRGTNIGEVILADSGTGARVSAVRNTMLNIGGFTTNATYETANGTNQNQVNNDDANNNVRTVFPSAAVVPDEPEACRIDVTVQPPVAGGTQPTYPVLVDAYIGGNKGLGQYLGRVKIGSAAELAKTVTFWYTGAGDGALLRLQSVDAEGKSSMISRTVNAAGPDRCGPALWIQQGISQADPTFDRKIVFDVMSSEAIQGGLTAAAFEFSGTAKGQQVVSITPVDSNPATNTRWTVVTKANSTGTVVPTIKAGTVKDLVGNLNAGASNTMGSPDPVDPTIKRAPVNFAGAVDADEILGTDVRDLDHSVLYNSPLALTAPADLKLSVTEPGGTAALDGTYRVENVAVDDQGRVKKAPQDTLVLEQSWSNLVPDPALPNPGQAANALAKTLANNPAINATSPTMTTLDRFVDIKTQAIDNLVVDGTRHVALSTAVVSTDEEFAGLLLEDLDVSVLDNDQPVAASSVLAVQTNNVLATGQLKNVLTATVKNADGALVSNAPVTFNVPANTSWVGADGIPGTADDVVGGDGVQAVVATNASGVATIELVSITAGAYPIHAYVNGNQEISGSPKTVSFTRVPIDLTSANTNFTVSTGGVVADGASTHEITVSLRDNIGNPATGWAASLAAAAAPNSGVTVSAFAATATPGLYSATVKSTVSGNKTVTVTVTDDASVAHSLTMLVGGNNVASFTAGTPEVGAGKSTVSIDDNNNRVANGVASHTVTTVLKDANNNPVTGAAASLSATIADNANAAVVAGSFVETSTPGVYTVQVTSTEAGAQRVTVSFDGTLDIGTVVANYAAGAVDLDNPGTTYTVSTGDKTVGTGSHTVTVTLADEFGNPVSGQSAQLVSATASNLGTGTVSGFTETSTAGTYTATVTSTIAGAKPMTAQLTGQAITLAGNGDAQFVSAGVDLGNSATHYSVSTGDVSVDGGSHSVTVTLADEFGNPVSGKDALLTASNTGSLGTGSISAFTESATAGTYTATVTSSVSGGKTITATLDGDDVTLSGNDVASFTAGGVDPSNAGTTYSVSTGDQTVGSGEHTVTVTLADANGNPVSGQEDGLTASTLDSLGTGEIADFFETSTAGTYTAAVTSTVAGAKQITAAFGADEITLDGNDVATFISAGVDLGNASTNYSVSTGDQPVGTGTHVVLVKLADAFGNPVSGKAAELSAAAAEDLGTGTITDFTELSPAGTYSATITSTVAGGKTVEVTLGAADVALSGNRIATFVSGSVDLGNASSNYTVSTGEVSIDGGSHSVTLKLADEFGNPVTGQAALLVAATTDALGSGSVSAVTETATAGTYTASISSSIAGDKTVTATFDGNQVTLVGNNVASFTSGGVDLGNAGTKYSVSSGDQTVGTGSHTVTVTLSDAEGNAVPGQAAALTASTADSLGTGGISAFVETSTAGTYTAMVTSTIAGGKVITATLGAGSITLDGNDTAAFVSDEVDLANAATSYSVSTGEVSVAGGSHSVTVILADQFGNPVSGQVAKLNASTADSLGTGTITGFVETATAGTYAATITSSSAGDKTVTARFDGDDVTLDGNDVATFISGGVDLGNAGTAFTVSTGDKVVGSTPHSIEVTLSDADGNPVPGQAAGLSATAVGSLGTGVISAFTETATAGTYSATIGSTIAGEKTVTVNFGAGKVTKAGNDVANFIAAGVDLSNAATSYSVSTGDESIDGGSHTATVTLADAYGNPVSGAASLILAATTDGLGSGAISAFTESATAGTYTASVTSSIAGSKAVTATFEGLDVSLDGNGSAAFVAGDVDLGNAGTAYSVSTGDQTVGTGEHTVTVTLADAEGNPVGGKAGKLSASSTDSLGTGTIGSFTESATAGTYTAVVTSTVAGAKAIMVEFDADQVTLDGNDVASFVAAGVDLSNASTNYSVSSGDQTVVSGSHTVTVKLADEFGNPVSGQSALIASATAADLGTGSVSDVSETGAAGTYTATVTSSVAGAKALTATFDGNPVTLNGNGVATFVAGSVDLGNPATNYSVSTGDQPVATGTHTITVALQDAVGNPVLGQAALLEATTTDALGTGTVSSFTEVGQSGIYKATVTSTIAGGKNIAVTLDGADVTLAGNGAASFTAGSVDLDNGATVYSVSTGNQPVGSGTHTVTVALADEFGNPVSGQDSLLAPATTGDLGTGSFGAFVESATAGTYTATVTSSVSGAKPVTVTFDGDAVTLAGNNLANFVSGGVDLGNPASNYTVSTGDVSIDGGSHSVTVTLADEFGNAVGGKAAQLLAATADSLGSGSIAAFTESATAGTYTATVTSSVAGGKTIAATFDGDPITLAGNDVASFIAGGVDLGNAGTKYSVSTGDETVGTGSHTVTVQLSDAEGNPVPGQAGTLTASTTDALGTGSITAFTESTTAGTYTATITSTIAGGKDVVVALGAGSITLDGNKTATFVAASVDLGNAATSYSVSTGEQTVGTGSHTATVTLADEFGNPVSDQAAALTASTADALGTGVVSGFVESATAGTYTASITSTVAGAKTIAVALGSDDVTLDGNDVATFVSAGVDLGNSATSYSVSSGDASVDGGSHSVTVLLADEFGNPVSGQAALVAASTPDALGSGSISAFAETVAGTYVATVTSSVSGGKTIAATFDGDDVTLDGNDTATFIAGGVDTGNAGTAYSVSIGDETVGTGSHTVTVLLADADGNPVPGQAAGLTASTTDDLGTGSISSFTESTTAGTYTATVTSTIAGGKTITATFGGNDVTLDGNDTASFVSAGVDLGNSATTYSVSSGDASVDGGSHSVTVLLADEFGNPVSGQASHVAASTSDALGSGSISAFAETVAGTYVATVTSSVSGGKTIAATFDGDDVTLDGNTVATFIAGGVDTGNAGTAYSVSIGDETVGTGSHTVTVLLADADGNAVPGQAAGLTASTTDDLGTGSISAFTESTTAGTYTATVTSTIAGGKAITATFGGNDVTLDGNDTASFVSAGVDLGNSATSYSVTTGDQTVGTGSHTVTVTLADEFGNPVAGQATGLVAATVAGLGAGSITSFTESTTAGTYTAEITSTLAGAKAITVNLGVGEVTLNGNDTASFVSAGVDVGNASTSYSVTTGEVSVAGGSHTVTAVLADEFGNPVSGQAAELLAATADALGTGSITAFVETATAGTYTATVTSSVAGSKVVAATIAGDSILLNGNGTAVFIAGGVDTGNAGTKYSVSTGDQTVGSGSHTVTVLLADADGNPVPGQAAGIVASTTDDLGTGSISAFTESATAGTYTATVTSTVTGHKNIAATFGGDDVTLDGNDTAAFVSAGVDLGNSATSYSVSTGDETVGTGSHTVTVTLVDEFGNGVPALAGDLTAATAQALGTGSVSAFTETATAGTYTATVTSTVSGNKVLTVTLGSDEVTLDGNDTAAFVSAGVDLGNSATSYSVSTGDQTVGTGSHTVTVTLVDEFGNGVPARAGDLTASTADALGSGALSAFTETATAGTYTATITSTVAGDKTITVALGSDEVTLDGNDMASFVSAGVDLGNSATSYSVSTGDQTVGTGSHTVTVKLADEFANPVSGQSADLSATTLSDLGAGTVTGFVETATAGTYTATVTSTIAGGKTITATFGGNNVTLDGNDVATFVSAGVDLGNSSTTYSVSSGDASVDGGSHSVTVLLADEFGNPVSGQAALVAASTSDALGSGSISAFAETVAGTYVATVTSSVSGGKTIAATFDGDDVTLDGNTVATFIAGGVDTGNAGTKYSVSIGDETVGTGSHTVTVLLADADGNAVPGQAAGLTASTTDDLGTGSISSFTESTTAGTYTATVTSTIAGGKAITATFGGNDVTLDGNDTASFVSAGVDLGNSATSYSVSTGDQTVGTGSHTVTVTLADEFGNPVAGQAAELVSTTADALGTGAISAFTESATAGTYTATVTSTVAGAKAIAATLSGNPVTLAGNSAATFVAGGVDVTNAATQFVVTSGDVSVEGGEHSVTITLADEFGNPVSDEAASLTAATIDGLGTGVITAVTETATAGTYTATVTSSVSGGKTVTARFGAQAITLVGNGVASFVAGGVDLSNSATSYSVSTGNQPVGTGAHTVTVTLADTAGNAVPGQANGLTAATADSIGTGSISAFAETTTAGTYEATITSSVSGGKDVTVTFGGGDVQADGNDVARFTAGAVDPGNGATNFVVTTGDQLVGSGSHTVTVSLADEFGNAVPEQAATLAATTADAIGTGSISGFVETATAGTYEATVTSTVTGGKTIAVTVGGSQVTPAGNTVASFTAGDVDLGNGSTNYGVSLGDVSVIGGSHLVTITLTDEFGNGVPGQAALLVATTGDDLGTGAISAVTETATAGVYEAVVTSSVSGAKTIGVEFDGDAVTLNGNNIASFVAGGVDPSNPGTSFEVSTGDELVGTGSHTVTVTLADANGNPVPGQAAGLTASSIHAIGTGTISAFVETGTAGTYTASISSTVAGVKDLAVKFGAGDVLSVGNHAASFVAGDVDLTNGATGFSVSTGAATVVAETHTVTATLADSFGNPVSGQADALVALTSDDLGAGAIGSFIESATAGTYTATITSSAAGIKVETVTYGGSAVTRGGNNAALFIADVMDPSQTVITAVSPVVANGTDASTVTVTLHDQYGNLITARTPVALHSTIGTLGTVTFDAGTYTAQLRSKIAGTAAVTVDVNGAATGASADVVFLDRTAPEPPVVDVTDGGTVTGCAEPGSTVTIYDANGNEIGSAIAGDDCRFEIVLNPKLEPGTEITVVATDPDGNVSGKVTVRVGLIWMELQAASLEAGQKQVAYGHNFQPGETVSGLLQSTPVDLGTQVADRNGDVTFEFTLPSDIEIGTHTVTLSADYSGSVKKTFQVVATTGLVVTGGDDLAPLGYGILLVLAGGALFLLATKRRREETEQNGAHRA